MIYSIRLKCIYYVLKHIPASPENEPQDSPGLNFRDPLEQVQEKPNSLRGKQNQALMQSASLRGRAPAPQPLVQQGGREGCSACRGWGALHPEGPGMSFPSHCSPSPAGGSPGVLAVLYLSSSSNIYFSAGDWNDFCQQLCKIKEMMKKHPQSCPYLHSMICLFQVLRKCFRSSPRNVGDSSILC